MTRKRLPRAKPRKDKSAEQPKQQETAQNTNTVCVDFFPLTIFLAVGGSRSSFNRPISCLSHKESGAVCSCYCRHFLQAQIKFCLSTLGTLPCGLPRMSFALAVVRCCAGRRCVARFRFFCDSYSREKTKPPDSNEAIPR